MEAGETREATLIREIQEEVGLDISPYPKRLLSESDTGEAVKTDKVTGEEWLIHMQFHVYQIDLPQDANDIEIFLKDDLKEYVWVPMHELKNYKHTPPSEKLFRSLGWL
jgi:8-oxo-dGTP pyrophosphatase MutT (NUDIX family)